MKKSMFVWSIALSVGLWSVAQAQDHKKEEPKKEAPKAAQPAQPSKPAEGKHEAGQAGEHAMEMMPPKLEPGPEHKLLSDCVGNWNVEQKMWDPSMGSEPMISKGTYKFTSTLDGLAVVGEYEVKSEHGVFKGHCFTTWNPTAKMYQGYWMDIYSMNGPDKYAGTYDAATKTLTSTSESIGPDGQPMKTKMVEKIETDKRHCTFYMVAPDGQEMKWMELTMARAK